VYVGTLIVEFHEEIAKEYCTRHITWDNLVNSRHMLKEVVKYKY